MFYPMYLSANTMLFCLIWLYNELEIRVYDTSSFVIFLRITLAIRGLWCCQINFRIFFALMWKNIIGILIWIALNLQIALGNMDQCWTIGPMNQYGHLNNVNSSSLWAEYSFVYIVFIFFKQCHTVFKCIDFSHPWLNLFLCTLLYMLLF